MATRFALICGIAIVIGPSFAVAVDGVDEISQVEALAGGVTAGDAPGFPVSLSVEGSYRLTSNLTVADASSAIVFGASGIHLDLNGFSIVGPSLGGGSGIDGGGSDRSTVRNGTIRGMGGHGIELRFKNRVVDMIISDVGLIGIFLQSDSLIANNLVKDSGTDGVSCVRSVVRDNFIGSSGANGIKATECLVTGNVIFCAGGYGLEATTGGWSSYSGNNITGPAVCVSGSGTVNVSGSFPPIQLGPNLCDSNTTCP